MESKDLAAYLNAKRERLDEARKRSTVRTEADIVHPGR